MDYFLSIAKSSSQLDIAGAGEEQMDAWIMFGGVVDWRAMAMKDIET